MVIWNGSWMTCMKIIHTILWICLLMAGSVVVHFSGWELSTLDESFSKQPNNSCTRTRWFINRFKMFPSNANTVVPTRPQPRIKHIHNTKSKRCNKDQDRIFGEPGGLAASETKSINQRVRIKRSFGAVSPECDYFIEPGNYSRRDSYHSNRRRASPFGVLWRYDGAEFKQREWRAEYTTNSRYINLPLDKFGFGEHDGFAQTQIQQVTMLAHLKSFSIKRPTIFTSENSVAGMNEMNHMRTNKFNRVRFENWEDLPSSLFYALEIPLLGSCVLFSRFRETYDSAISLVNQPFPMCYLCRVPPKKLWREKATPARQFKWSGEIIENEKPREENRFK